MKPLETLSVLPQGDGGRFGSIALGTDRVERLREEHLALRLLASCVIGKQATELSLEDVTSALDVVRARAATPDCVQALKVALESVLTAPGEWFAKECRDTVLWLLAAGMSPSAESNGR